MKTFLKLFSLGILISLLAIIICNYIVINTTKNQIFDNTDNIPYNNVGLLLGTGKYLKNGKINPYYSNRIAAAVLLYEANKINKIIISGDNSSVNYNEPQSMMDDLVNKGIPKENIYLDFAGLRTLDSVYRINTIFGQNSFTIISQKFHNERALYIANYLNLNAIAYNATDVSASQGLKTNMREKLARVKVFIDRLINKQPKFLGEEISIE